MQNTVSITGASSGIGKAAARLFAQKGWHVVATMRNSVKGPQLARPPNVLTPEDIDVELLLDLVPGNHREQPVLAVTGKPCSHFRPKPAKSNPV